MNTESIYTHLAWTKTARNEGGVQGLRIPLLSDFGKNIAKSYGVLVEDETDPYYGATLRGLFIIDGNGVVRSTTINDAPVGRNVDETLRLIQAFQHTDAHGDVCPANWKPGSATINPDQEKKKEYFEKAFNEAKNDF
eukprot:TRINITY_DN392_c0_g1_i2.p4 TRINITY_DN392_c0_g1~~TRINITY_DN392_c0_g1_i2.p4  ORF type:complete len:137 (-),score=39.03 TRINITY_DN392_c0_g1_i2:133-543(-)